MKKPDSKNKIVWSLFLSALFIIGAVFIFLNYNTPREVRSSLPEELTPKMTYAVVNSYPHDPRAFTQGLVYHKGYLYESTGLYSESSLRQVDLETGEVLRKVDLSDEFFAEGLAIYDNQLVQLTWREKVGFVYALEDFSIIRQFTYQTQGWGLTYDDQRLILSDGTDRLYFLDPNTFQVVDSLSITYQGQAIQRLNELEYIRGEIYANIWQTDDIVRINPLTGEVVGWIDLSAILPDDIRTTDTDVLNGIAYDPESDRLFITGKRWPKLYEIRLVPVSSD
ncbi:MAG: glutaminyl-peptide cyclotransferase [Chloroflexota bacterium]|nr:glutaminyl-peptide cyclotransferase [Chloroflexota bacterium]